MKVIVRNATSSEIHFRFEKIEDGIEISLEPMNGTSVQLTRGDSAVIEARKESTCLLQFADKEPKS